MLILNANNKVTHPEIFLQPVKGKTSLNMTRNLFGTIISFGRSREMSSYNIQAFILQLVLSYKCQTSSLNIFSFTKNNK